MENVIQMMKPDSFMALILFTYAHFSVSIIDDCWLESDTFEQNLTNTPDLGCILGSNYMTIYDDLIGWWFDPSENIQDFRHTERIYWICSLFIVQFVIIHNSWASLFLFWVVVLHASFFIRYRNIFKNQMLQLHQGNYEIVIIIPQEELQGQGISEATTLHINAWRDFY